MAITIFSITFLILALRRLDWAVLVLIVALPIYIIRFQVFELPSTLLEIMILMVFLIWSFKFYIPEEQKFKSQKNDRQAYPFRNEILILMVFSMIAISTSNFSMAALGIWRAYFVEPFLLYIVVINLFNHRLGIYKIIGALGVSAAIVAALAIFQEFSGLFINNPFWANIETRRVVSFFGYPNAVGLYLAPIIMLLIGWFGKIKNEIGYKINFIKIGILIIITASLLAIYFAHSEGALVALLASGLICLFLVGRRAKLAILSLILAVGIILAIFPTVTEAVIKKITLRDLSGEIRRQQWLETITMLEDRWLTGAGLSNYQKAVAPFHQEGIFYNFDNRPNFDAVVWASSSLQKIYWQPVEIYLYPHNIILNFWSELGIGGLLVFIWLIIHQIYLSLKLFFGFDKKDGRRYLALGLSGAMFTIIIHGLVDVPYFKNDLAALFWIIIALSGIMILENKNKLINKT